MEIIDKNGYLESALRYIEKNMIEGRNFQKLSARSGVDEVLLKKLSRSLYGFSEKYFLTSLHDKLEERHSSLGGADAEITFADVGIEVKNNKAFVLAYFNWDIVVDGEVEDRVKMVAEIFSKSNIIIENV